VKWRIYYADGSVLDGGGSPEVSPGKRFQVQIIAEEDADHGRQLLRFGDYYFWRSDLRRWLGVDGDLSCMMALTQHTEEITCLLWGSAMAPDDWAEIQKRAMNDPGLPKLLGERKSDVVRK